MSINDKYLAGFFDGEGTVSITHSRQLGYVLYVRINNTNLDILQEIKRKYGGCIIRKSNGKYNKPTFRQCYIWATTGHKAVYFLSKLLPELRLKKEQANLAIMFQKNQPHRGKKPTQEQMEFKEQCFQEMKRLNHRGAL